MGLRIAHIFNSFDYGGIETVFLAMLRNIPREYKAVSHVAIILAGNPAPGESRIPASVAVRRCEYRPGRRISLICRLAVLLRSISADIVLCWSFGNHWMAAVAARLAGVRKFYVSVQADPARNWKTMWKCMVAGQLARPFSNGEIACSETVARALTASLRLPRRRVIAIPNGCETEMIAIRANRSRALSGDGSIRVISISRMDDAKDHPTLLKAVRDLSLGGFPARVMLVGDGPRRADHEALAAKLGISSRVEFVGRRLDVPELLGQSDVFVHCTHTEGLGVALLEAMAASVPVVATDLAACREVLDGGRCGLLVPPGDAAAVAAAIRRLAEDERLRAQLVEAAKNRVRVHYDCGTQARSYLERLVRE
jgi:glycosyltransferase involved in cell wall biosynthesis